jgi:hypothetical protein
LKEKIENAKFLEERKLRSKFFHRLYDDNSRATICILLDDKNKLIARGTSICSSADQFRFSKREGRASSLGRAVKAIVNKKNSLPLVNRILSCDGIIRSNEAFDEISRTYKYKSEYKPFVDCIPWSGNI